jgi:hypothetical protein
VGFVDGAVFVELNRVQEGLDQADMVRRQVGVQARHRVGQHRMTETVDHVGKLLRDRRVDVG